GFVSEPPYPLACRVLSPRDCSNALLELGVVSSWVAQSTLIRGRILLRGQHVVLPFASGSPLYIYLSINQSISLLSELCYFFFFMTAVGFLRMENRIALKTLT
ncbi:unnamed protein product, partial [Ectocarpus sp. 8 AP-2014]